MLISPTEPKLLRSIGTTSSIPETYGCDFLFASTYGLVGVQRKEIKDLVASLRDGRLARELAMMKKLQLGILLIEGRWQWSEDGYALNVRSFTKDQMNGVSFSVQAAGLWYLPSEDAASTATMLRSLAQWLLKARHSGFQSRPKVQGEWGKASSREFGIHLLQSFDGIGPEVAGRIYDEVGIPLQWTVDELDLMAVKGVGKVRAQKMMEALDQ